MELAHSEHDSVLAAFLEPGTLPDIAKRVNMSLASLAKWAAKHAQLLDALHTLLIARAKLIAAHIEVSALSALAAVSSSSTTTDDPRLRERSLERQRKAAGAILRHRVHLQRTPSATSGPHAPPNANSAADVPLQQSELGQISFGRDGHSQSVRSTARHVASGVSVPAAPRKPPKPSLAERFAARRLATLNTV